MKSLNDDFQFLGIKLPDWPDIIGLFSGKRLIICGGAACVWDDIALLGVNRADSRTHFMTVNDISMHLPMKVEHLYSNDYKMIPLWMGARRHQYLRKYGPIPHTHSRANWPKYGWPWPGHGTSALGAVYTAIALGYDSIILCGVPLDNSPMYFSPPWKDRNFVREVPVIKETGQMAYWANAARKCFRGRVKSMSGRTRDLLGEP